MDISFHTAGGNDFAFHKKQIDAAADYGARVLVLHTDDLADKSSSLDVELGRKAVSYANGRGIDLALENGELSFLVDAVRNIEGLGICLDVGHIYSTSDPIEEFLQLLKHRVIHLHVHDVLKSQTNTVDTFMEHYILGTGKIPRSDWDLLIRVLKEIDFDGMAVFEIAPRTPLQTALLARTFMEDL